MTKGSITYHGNIDLLRLPQHGFLCSRATKSTAILPSLEWAQQMALGEEAVASTFHSEMERAVLGVLAMGTCPVVLVLGRAPYRRMPPHLQGLLDSGRLLIISLCRQRRISRESAQRCADYVARHAHSLTFGFLSPDNALFPLYAMAEENNVPTNILAT